MKTLQDLLQFCREEARIASSDYFELGFARPEEIRACRRDSAHQTRARRRCYRAFPGRLNRATEPLIPGFYGPSGRLRITADGTADYIPGQYAPLEIYDYLLAYLEATNHA